MKSLKGNIMYCPNCFAFIADDSTVCFKCKCIVKTEGCLTQKVINSEVTFQKQGFGFEKYSVYKTRMFLNETYENIKDKEHKNDLKYLTHVCIAVNFGILIFGLDDFTIINAIIATVLGYVASIILRKILDKSHFDEVKGYFITENEKDNSLSLQYEMNVLKPLEDSIVSKLVSQYPNVKSGYSLFEQMNVVCDGTATRRAQTIWNLFKKKAGKFGTLEEYREEASEICRNDIIKSCIEVLKTEIETDRVRLLKKATMYRKELYSADLNAMLSAFENIPISDDKSENGYQNMLNLKYTVNNTMDLLKEEQQKIELLFKRQSNIRLEFITIEKEIANLLYYSKSFQEYFHFVESVALISKINTKITFDDLKTMLDKAENSIKELKMLYELERSNAEEMYEQQKNLAIELMKKLDEVLAENNDVRYSTAIETMTNNIRKSIFVYEDEPQALNPDNVNENIKVLIKARKHERNKIFNTIQNYEKQLHELCNKGKVYERPNAGVIANKFLERKKSN